MHAQGEWYCQACTERGCQPKVKPPSPPKKQKPKALKPAAKSSGSKGFGGKKPAKKSALSFGAVKSRPVTGAIHSVF